MTDKVCLAKGNPVGNLHDTKQLYYVHYLLKTERFPDKIEIALITPSEKGDGESVYRSLRFVDPSTLYLFILDCCKAWAYFKKQRGDLSEFNVAYYQADLSRKFLSIERDVLRGVYDG